MIMKKKVFLVLVLICSFIMTGCESKSDYEKLWDNNDKAFTEKDIEKIKKSFIKCLTSQKEIKMDAQEQDLSMTYKGVFKNDSPMTLSRLLFTYSTDDNHSIKIIADTRDDIQPGKEYKVFGTSEFVVPDEDYKTRELLEIFALFKNKYGETFFVTCEPYAERVLFQGVPIENFIGKTEKDIIEIRPDSIPGFK